MSRDPEQAAEAGALPSRRRTIRREEDRRLIRRDRELEAARRVTEALFEHLTTETLVANALQTALDVVGAESGSILLADAESRQLVFRHSIGKSPVQVGTTIPWDLGIAGEVFHSGVPMVIHDAQADPRHFPGIDKLTGHETHDMITVPLKRWEGEPIGVLQVLNKREGRLDEDDVALLTIVSAIAATSIEQARLYQDAKLAEVARILGNIGHDIKNLLMPVVCGTGLLEGEIKELLESSSNIQAARAKASFELCREVIGMVRSSTRRIHDRVREIADCIKGLSAPPEFAPCQVAAVVESVFKTLHWLAQEQGVTLQVKELDHLPPIVADERRLFNAFYNLVNNAIPEVQPGGSVTISGRTEDDGKHILISVADTGRGIPPDVLRTLFTPRTISRKAGGTGLGTKIVKDVVDAHGGEVTVDSQVGVGTTFHLRLPLQPPGA
ncbi:MAG: HAMP domain-containing sensor histidine kinase [Nitrospirota bacterium]